jgi:hypothetical protein
MSLEKQSQPKERVFVHQPGSEHRIRRENANIFKKAPRGENASANAFLVAPKMEGETSKLRVCFFANDADLCVQKEWVLSCCRGHIRW